VVIASAALTVSSLVTVLASTTEPDAVSTPDADTVSPGFAGFMTVFLLAVVTVFLVRSMTGHLRRAKFTADQSEQAEGAAEASGPPGTAVPVEAAGVRTGDAPDSAPGEAAVTVADEATGNRSSHS